MPQFTMSMYATREDLYKAKADYYMRLSEIALNRLEELEEVHKDDDSEWIGSHCGEYVLEK